MDFTPTETLLCLAAMLDVDHNRYGGLHLGRVHVACTPQLCQVIAPTTPTLRKVRLLKCRGIHPLGVVLQQSTPQLQRVRRVAV